LVFKSQEETFDLEGDIRSNYKPCERFNNLIDKKIIVTQKLNEHHCKEQLQELLFVRVRNGVSLIFVWPLLSYQQSYAIAHAICNSAVLMVSV
jgi:hypothetical protein